MPIGPENEAYLTPEELDVLVETDNALRLSDGEYHEAMTIAAEEGDAAIRLMKNYYEENPFTWKQSPVRRAIRNFCDYGNDQLQFKPGYAKARSLSMGHVLAANRQFKLIDTILETEFSYAPPDGDFLI